MAVILARTAGPGFGLDCRYASLRTGPGFAFASDVGEIADGASSNRLLRQRLLGGRRAGILAYQLRDYDQRRGGNLHTIGLLAKEQGGHQHRHYDFQ
jgi:hypothetical protein